MTKKHKTKKNTEPPIYVTDPRGKLHKYGVTICNSGMREIQGRFGGKTLKHRAETREQLERRIKDTRNDSDGKSGDNITFFNACKAYITRRSALAETTRHTYTIIAQSYFGSLHDKPIMKLTREEIFAAVNTEIERGIAQKTLKTALTFLSCVCNEYEVPSFTRKLQADISNWVQRPSWHTASCGFPSRRPPP